MSSRGYWHLTPELERRIDEDYVVASRLELDRLLAMPARARARLPAQAVADLTDADKTEFARRLEADLLAAGRQEATAAAIERWGRQVMNVVRESRAVAGERSARIATAFRDAPAAGRRAMAVGATLGQQMLGTAWIPVAWLGRAAGGWVPLVMVIPVAAVLNAWVVPPAGANAAQWRGMVSNLAPTYLWLAYLATATLMEADLRRPLKVCAVLQGLAAVAPIFRWIGVVADATAKLYEPAPTAGVLGRLGEAFSAVIGAVGQASPYDLALIATAVLLGVATWKMRAPEATATDD